MRRLLAILLWSVIAAAFIGPGTVTTCAAAGAGHGLALLWALSFSTLGCFVLQEAAARVTIVSGSSLACAVRERAPGGVPLVASTILIGCAAYQAGNIAGATAGAGLEFDTPRGYLTIGVVTLAFAVLAMGSAGTVARAMGIIVALMGLAFVVTAWRLGPDVGAIARGALVPSLPDGSGLLVVALVGTTIVPYNVFLGSGLARGHRIDEVRLGLAIAIGLGGVASMAVVVAGTALDGAFSFESLATALQANLGGFAAVLFAFGLFCAGFSSAVTAPLAAAITARGLFGESSPLWAESSFRYRAVWLTVLATGLGFGLSGVRPVPLIVLAQALNGVLLPVVAGFLLLLINDRRVMGEATNGRAANVALAATFATTVLLGAAGLLRSAAGALGMPAPGAGVTVAAAGVVTLAALGPLLRAARRRALLPPVPSR